MQRAPSPAELGPAGWRLLQPVLGHLVLDPAHVALVESGSVAVAGDAPPDLALLVGVHVSGGDSEEQLQVLELLAPDDAHLLQREVGLTLP